MRRLGPAIGAVIVLGSLVLLVLLVLPDDRQDAPSGQARGRDDDGPAPVVEEAARRLLERAAAAPATASYTGTQFVAAWSSDVTASQLLEVSHTPEAGTTWLAAGSDGTGGTAVRSAARSADPSILGDGAVALMSRHYSLAAGGTARVAGRAVDVVEARRPATAPQHAPVARFWLDDATGLVLRREVYDDRGRPIRATAFVDVTVSQATSSSPALDGGGKAGQAGQAWSSALDGAALHRMRTRGWDCPSTLPGPLPLVDARRGGAGKEIIHLSYADGIASISVFQQRGSLDRENLRGYRRETVDGQDVWVRAEIPRRVVWSAGGTVYTVVADAPERTVDRAVDALHAGAKERAGGPMDRLGRGLDRVGSWFNPFE